MSGKIGKWSCDGFRTVVNPIEPFDAGEHFAGIAARREYGKNGVVGALRLDSWTPDGKCRTYNAFIGRYDKETRSTTGHNIFLTVMFEEVA